MLKKIACVISIILGIIGLYSLANIDNASDARHAVCSSYGGNIEYLDMYLDCLESADKDMNARLGWGGFYIAVGVLVGIPTAVSWYKDSKYEEETAKNNANRDAAAKKLKDLNNE